MHHLLKTMRVFAWFWYLQKLVSVGAIHRFIFSFFANQNFSRHRKTELLRKWITLVPQVTFHFMGCLVKVNALTLGNRFPSVTQYSGNIRWVFPQCHNVRDIYGTFREHFKEKNFIKSSPWKSCFSVKSVWFDNNKYWSFGKFQ